MRQRTRGGVALETNFVVMHIPNDPQWLAAFGRVSVAHAHLDYVLRMTIKTLTNVSVAVALDATERDGAASLRERIRKIGRSRLGEGQPLVRLQALIERCQRATERRNRWTHDVIVSDWEHVGARMQQAGGQSVPLPSPEELAALSGEIIALVHEINEARLEGWLYEALKLRPIERVS